MGLQTQTMLILLAVLLLSSCATHSQFVDPRVNIINQHLASDIFISKVSSVRNDSDFLEAQVTGVNQTASYKQLEYRIEWLDQNGLVIPTILSRWTEFPAFENTEFRFRAIAPRITATDFRILIRKRD